MNESPQAKPKKEMRPILPIKDFEDVLVQLKPDPSCRECYGRGYMSFTRSLQGGMTMNLCGCATFGETELLKVLRSIGMTIHAVNSLGAALSEALSRIEKNQANDVLATTEMVERLERELGIVTKRVTRPNIVRRMVNWVDRVNKRKEEMERTGHEEQPTGASQ